MFPAVVDCNPSKGCAQVRMIATAGRETSFLIQSRDFWGNRRTEPEQVDLQLMADAIQSQLSLNNSIRVDGSISGPIEGVYIARFTPTRSGLYAVQVFLKSSPMSIISGAPFQYNVKPTAIWPPLCFVIAKRSFKSSAGIPATFSIQVSLNLELSQ